MFGSKCIYAYILNFVCTVQLLMDLYDDLRKYQCAQFKYKAHRNSCRTRWLQLFILAQITEFCGVQACVNCSLQVSRHLFRWTKEMAYADYYERALTNGVLSIQRGTDPGVMIYMLPLHPGGSKAKSYHGWGTKFDSFWCCYGTGMGRFPFLVLANMVCFCEMSNIGISYDLPKFVVRIRDAIIHRRR